MKYSLLAIVVYSFVFFCASAVSQPLDVTHGSPEPIGKSVQYLIESVSPLDLGAAIEAHSAGKFTVSKDPILNFGMGSKPAWLRFEVVNPGTTPVLRLLSLETSWIDKVDVHFLQDGKAPEVHHAGDALPFSERPAEDRFFVFRHAFQPGATTVFIRAETLDPLVLPIYLTSTEQAQTRQAMEGYGYGFLYGIIFALLAYNLMLYFSLRNGRYFYYSIYLAFFLLMNASYTGHGFRWLWSDHPEWQLWSNPVLIMLFALSGLLFATRFLNTRLYFPRLHRAVIRICIGFGTLEALAVATGNHLPALLLAFVFVFLFSVGMVVLGALSIHAGNKSAKYFVLASITHASCSSVTALAVWGLIPYSTFAYHAVEIGMVVDAILLAMALADQFRINQEDRIRAEKLARVDPLTGLNNRRSFYEIVNPIWAGGLRKRKDMSVILMDVDRFKSINDTYGHAHGDNVLIGVARTLMKDARAGDILARWGGEEFILFLPETTLDEATSIAERFRSRISSIPADMERGVDMLTASFGIAHTEEPTATLDDLISAADRQLYKAKAMGRDRVCSGQLLTQGSPD